MTTEGVTFLSNMAAGEYLLCFSEKCNREDVKQYFVNCLSREKFSVTRQEFEGKTLLIIFAPFSVLAEKVNTLVLTEPMKSSFYNLKWTVLVIDTWRFVI